MRPILVLLGLLLAGVACGKSAPAEEHQLPWIAKSWNQILHRWCDSEGNLVYWAPAGADQGSSLVVLPSWNSCQPKQSEQ